jgi:hypothetical protein
MPTAAAGEGGTEQGQPAMEAFASVLATAKANSIRVDFAMNMEWNSPMERALSEQRAMAVDGNHSGPKT